MKICSTPQVIREIQIKMTMGYVYTLTRISKIKVWPYVSVVKIQSNWALIHCLWDCLKWYFGNHAGEQFGSFLKIKHVLPISLPDIYSREVKTYLQKENGRVGSSKDPFLHVNRYWTGIIVWIKCSGTLRVSQTFATPREEDDEEAGKC